MRPGRRRPGRQRPGWLPFALIVLVLPALPAAAADYASKQAGNLTVAGTWNNVETGSGAMITTQSAAANTAVAYATAVNFTCTNNNVVTRVWLHGRRVTVDGTVTIGLSDDGGASWTREVTVNATDLPTSYSWVPFELNSAYTCDGGADYRVSFKGSSAGNGSFYRDATANNWNRILQLDSSPGAAPVAGDILWIAGKWTGAGTGADITVTMDDTASVDYGNITVGQRGVFQSGVVAATLYTLKMSGDLTVWGGAVLNMPGTAMPADSSLDWTFDCTSNVQYGLLVKDGGTFTTKGATKTFMWTLLSADAAVNDTTLTTSDVTGWKDGDVIAIAPTTRTYTQSEKGTLNGDAVGNTLTVDGFGGAGGGLAYAHSGTSPMQAHVINLSRNVKIHGASETFQAYLNFAALATVTMDYVEMYQLGSNTAGKRGVDLLTTTGSASIQHSSIHDFAVANTIALSITGSASSNITISHNVGYRVQAIFFSIGITSGTWTLADNVFIYTLSATNSAVALGDVGGTVTDLVVAGCAQDGINFQQIYAVAGVMNGLNAYGCGAIGIDVQNPLGPGSLLQNLTAKRNNGTGISIGGSTQPQEYPLTIDGFQVFGNNTRNIYALDGVYGLTLKNGTLNGDTTFATTYGLATVNGVASSIRMENVDFGVAAGILTTHSTADLLVPADSLVLWTGMDVTLASGTQVSGVTGMDYITSMIGISKLGGVAGTHKSWFKHGTINSDSAIFHTAAPSSRMTPLSGATSTLKFQSGPKYVALNNGATVTVSAWVRKSQAADAGGADYDGSQPRLVVKANPAAGIASDTVLDTMTVAVGNWELLTGTTAAVTDDAVLEFRVDCDFGTAGWINVDDWTATGGQDMGTNKYWFTGLAGDGTAAAGAPAGGRKTYSVIY